MDEVGEIKPCHRLDKPKKMLGSIQDSPKPADNSGVRAFQRQKDDPGPPLLVPAQVSLQEQDQELYEQSAAPQPGSWGATFPSVLNLGQLDLPALSPSGAYNGTLPPNRVLGPTTTPPCRQMRDTDRFQHHHPSTPSPLARCVTRCVSWTYSNTTHLLPPFPHHQTCNMDQFKIGELLPHSQCLSQNFQQHNVHPGLQTRNNQDIELSYFPYFTLLTFLLLYENFLV